MDIAVTPSIFAFNPFVLRIIGNGPYYGGNHRAIVPFYLAICFRVVGSFQMMLHTQDPHNLVQKLGVKLRTVVG